jgi:ammonia channel protein AmtB
MSTAAIAFQWFFWGYSLTFFDTAGLYVRNDKSIELNGFRKSQSSRANPLKRDTGCPGVDLEMQHFEVSKPHDVTNFVLGTALLWFGWCGFKCASVPGASFRDIRFTILRLRYFGVRVAPSSALLATGVAAFLGEILYRVGGIELMRSGSSPPIITDVIVVSSNEKAFPIHVEYY